MLFLGVLYISVLSGMAYYANKLSKSLLKDHKENEEDIEILNLNRNLNEDDKLFKSVRDNCIRANQGTNFNNKKVLVCCSGDNKSMALVTCIANIFGNDNTYVLLINHHKNNMLKIFVHDVCDYNSFKFFNYDYDNYSYFNNSNDLKTFRYNKINEICKKNDISFVFEGHTIENYCNLILHNFFSGKTFINTKNEQSQKPFLNLNEETINNFIYNYNIPIDENMVHDGFTNAKIKNIFTNIDKIYKAFYPDWQFNLARAYNATNNIINENTSNINLIINLQCNLSDYGFIYYHDLLKTSFGVYKIILNTLCDEYNIEHFSDNNIETMYTENNTYTIKFTNELHIKCNEFINKLNNVNPDEFMIALIDGLSEENESKETDDNDNQSNDNQSDDSESEDNESESEDNESESEDNDSESEDNESESEDNDSESEDNDSESEDNDSESDDNQSDDNESESDDNQSDDNDSESEDNNSTNVEYPLIAVDLSKDKYTYKMTYSNDIDFNSNLINGILYFTVYNNKFKFFY